MRTIANMVDRLSGELEFFVVTADRDTGDERPYANIVVDGWNSVGQAKVFYTSPTKQTFSFWTRLIKQTPHEVLYLNSFFNPTFTIRPLLARCLGMLPKRSTVISPRGELNAEALALKAMKKRLFLTCARALRLYRDLTWQASSEFESVEIRKAAGTLAQRIMVAPNLSAIPERAMSEALWSRRSPGKPLRVCFLSRISPKKNLDYALRVLAHVAVPIHFTIYGVIEDKAYWTLCQGLVKNLPGNISVTSFGAIEPANVPAELAKHDLFFFPTKGENYGHVIHEALSAGLPVLISDQTPWRDLDKHGAGWDLPLRDPLLFRDVLEGCFRTPAADSLTARRQAVQFAMQVSRDKNVIAQNLHLFRRAAASGESG